MINDVKYLSMYKLVFVYVFFGEKFNSSLVILLSYLSLRVLNCKSYLYVLDMLDM